MDMKNVKTKLSMVIEAMERANVNEIYYLNDQNGRVWVSTDIGNYYIDNNELLSDNALFDNNSISLPSQYEINEYKAIKDFINTISDDQIKNQLEITIKGQGAFRRFKDSCINYKIIDKWYIFKKNSYYELAKEWCEWNNINFIDDVELPF